MKTNQCAALLLVGSLSSLAIADGATEFCLDGDLDLGARYQGTKPEAGEIYPTTWCVITEDNSQRVLFSGSGKSNPDMYGSWTVAYLPPDTVRIVNRESPPDVEFHGVDNFAEALRVRRIDPRRLVEEFRKTPTSLDGLHVEINGNRVLSVRTSANLPLRGHVSVEWKWDWRDAETPELRLIVDDTLLFKATGRWRELDGGEAAAVWAATPGTDPVKVSGNRWPARVNMQLVKLTDGVYLVTGVRTGFRHLVVATDEGLVIADAPAGWVEFHQLPPSNLVPGLGVSGLSENFIDFLREKFPNYPVHAVALTHFHDDHAGGARAFAAAGAKIYTTEESENFIATALSRASMPTDRLSKSTNSVSVSPVVEAVVIGSEPNRVKLVPMGSGPHSYAMLGVWAIDKDYYFVSDVHVPRSDAEAPRQDRAATECWFADWAVNNLSQEVRVVNSHSDTVTPVSRLAAYLESDLCAERE